MKKRRVLSALAFIVVGVCGSVAIAMPPMGPPRATLQEGQSSFGLEFSHSEMDLEAFGTLKVLDQGAPSWEPYYRKYKIESLKSNMFLGRLGAGLWENWDIFVRFGITDAQDEITEVLANDALGDQYKDFDGSSGFALGLGTRATFYQEGNTTWGGLLQITWSNPDGSSITDANDTYFSGDAEINYWEVQIAIGPTVEFNNCRFYGGPFLHFINGDLDINGKTKDPTTGFVTDRFKNSSFDIKEESQFGGYAGAQWYLGENSSLFTEFQFTNDAWGIGVGTAWKF